MKSKTSGEQSGLKQTPQTPTEVGMGSRYRPQIAIGVHFWLCPHSRYGRGTEEDLISCTVGSRQAGW